ncbi:hypothetical protein GIB67_022049, partial [Kingdonia uniflora]
FLERGRCKKLENSRIHLCSKNNLEYLTLTLFFYLSSPLKRQFSSIFCFPKPISSYCNFSPASRQDICIFFKVRKSE